MIQDFLIETPTLHPELHPALPCIMIKDFYLKPRVVHCTALYHDTGLFDCHGGDRKGVFLWRKSQDAHHQGEAPAGGQVIHAHLEHRPHPPHVHKERVFMKLVNQHSVH